MRSGLVLLTGAILACVSGCGSPGHRADPSPQNGRAAVPPDESVIPPDSPKLKQIRTETVAEASVPVGNVIAPGSVEANANRLSHVVLPLTGRVSNVQVKIGDYVRKGQVLLTMESADADAAVSAYQQALASTTEKRSALAKAQMDLDREEDLFAHGAVPQKDVLNAKAIVVQAKAGVDQSQAVTEQALRRLQLLGIGPDHYGQRVTVNAPISGKVLDLSVVDGEFRNDLSAPMMTIADLSNVWVTSDVPETAIRLVKLNEPVHIELSAYPGQRFDGRVTMISDTVDPQTRTVKVRAELPNPDGRLKPQMFGNIQLTEQTEPRLTIPAAAVIATENQPIVWRESSRGVFHKISVTTGPQVGERVAILNGLAPGDRVVVDGVMLLGNN